MCTCQEEMLQLLSHCQRHAQLRHECHSSTCTGLVLAVRMHTSERAEDWQAKRLRQGALSGRNNTISVPNRMVRAPKKMNTCMCNGNPQLLSWHSAFWCNNTRMPALLMVDTPFGLQATGLMHKAGQGKLSMHAHVLLDTAQPAHLPRLQEILTPKRSAQSWFWKV